MTFDRREAITKLLEAVNYKIEEIRNSAIESFI
jgi:predicted Holliday junction resolvase-like endonuclease